MKVRPAMCFCLVLAAFALSADYASNQSRLEEILAEGITPSCTDDGTPDVPLRNRNSIPRFGGFLERSGWTTNQLVEGLMLAFTNNISAESLSVPRNRRIAGVAVWMLNEIDLPVVTNLFRLCNEDDSPRFKSTTIPGMFQYTNLEPEVLSYMRNLCIRTNIYDSVATMVMHDMFETLETMPDAMKPAATNRVAQYMYFAIHHTTRQMAWQDRELAKFIPTYSNSIQRLNAMQYVYATATNTRQRARAQMEIERLSSLPTNQLNDVSWIVE